jgi:plastocyanin
LTRKSCGHSRHTSTPSVRASRGLLPPFVLLLCALLLGACDREPPPLAAGGDPDPAAEVYDRITGPGDGGEVHFIRLLQRPDQYAFDPAESTIPSGDVVRFVMVGGKPESVVFDPAGATPAEAAEFVLANGLHFGVLLTEAGQAYDVPFRDAPSGRYPFRSVPHEAEGMRGVVVVVADDA